jgi:methyl-accepting chemotaxis protein
MTDLSPSERRTDIINSLLIRLAVLEASHNELSNARLTHAAVLEKLSTQDTALVLSLNSISIKFDDLIKQIGMGIKIVLTCTAILSTIIGGFYVYSRDLDARYSPKLESIVTNTVQQKAKIDATSRTVKENTETLEEQSSQLEHVTGKVNEVSGAVGTVSSDVKAIKKLKAVRGSR